jgi:DNA-binding winged helix-turn-helix (wHTH) protein
MAKRYSKIIVAFFVCIISFSVQNFAHTDIGEKQINVTMRMIGHEVLLCSNDSESLILAVEKVEDRYKIEFSSDFEFKPDDLIPIVSENLQKIGITESYIVEVEECESKKIIYNYQKGGLVSPNITPCVGRSQPMACYKIFITLLDASNQSSLIALNNTSDYKSNLSKDLFVKEPSNRYAKLSFFGIPVLLLFGLFLLYINRKDKSLSNPNLISIGNYYFNANNMQLLLDKEVTELTSKESDLLSLLHKNTNQTLEREFILNSVWGDDGDYVGRTLDVFISKLRKKLEADATIKIVNIRGVGYKLIQSI